MLGGLLHFEETSKTVVKRAEMSWWRSSSTAGDTQQISTLLSPTGVECKKVFKIEQRR